MQNILAGVLSSVQQLQIFQVRVIGLVCNQFVKACSTQSELVLLLSCVRIQAWAPVAIRENTHKATAKIMRSDTAQQHYQAVLCAHKRCLALSSHNY
jgi:hypothetical protein